MCAKCGDGCNVSIDDTPWLGGVLVQRSNVRSDPGLLAVALSFVGGDGERPAEGRAAQASDCVELGVLDPEFAGRQRTDGPAQPELNSSRTAILKDARPRFGFRLGRAMGEVPGEHWNTRFLGT